MKARLELKPGLAPQQKPSINHSVERFGRFLKNLRFFLGSRPELELSPEDLSPSQSLTDIKKKTGSRADYQAQKGLNAFERFIDGAMDFLSAFGLILAGDLSYDPDNAPAPEPQQPAPNAKDKEPPKAADPLAWKKRKAPQLSLGTNHARFTRNLQLQNQQALALSMLNKKKALELHPMPGFLRLG